MEMTITISDRTEDGERGYYRCTLKRGKTIMLQMPPVKDAQSERMLDFSAPLVDFMAEYDGCESPGQALEVFGRALDSILARDAWENMDKEVPRESDDR